jgi:hypothetical protein
MCKGNEGYGAVLLEERAIWVNWRPEHWKAQEPRKRMQSTFEPEMVHGLGAAQMIVLGRGRGRASGAVGGYIREPEWGDAGGYSREPEWGDAGGYSHEPEWGYAGGYSHEPEQLASSEKEQQGISPVNYCAVRVAVQQLSAVVGHTKWEDPEYAEVGKPEVRSHSSSLQRVRRVCEKSHAQKTNYYRRDVTRYGLHKSL